MAAKIVSSPVFPAATLAELRLSIVEQAPLPMAMVEGTGHTVRQVNAAFCRLVGKTREELLGGSFAPIFGEQGARLEVLDRVFRLGYAESYTEEQPFTRPTALWTYTMWPVMADGHPVGVMIQVNETTKALRQTVAMNEALVLGSVHQHELTEASDKLNGLLREEIAERTKLQQALAEKARLLDLSNDAIVVLDQKHRIQYWNHGAEEMYGWSQEEAWGKVSHELLHTHFAKPWEQIHEELLQTGRWTGELTHTKRDGRRIAVLVRKVMDRDSRGQPVAILEYMTDITERAKAVEELREARARLAEHAGQLEELVARRTTELTKTNEQLEALVYSIAHDLRAPLRSMQGFSALLVDETGRALSESAQDYAHRIDQSAQFMDALLSDLLAFSRTSQQHIELTATSLEQVVGAVLARLQKEIRETNARVECSGPWPSVRAHEPTLTLLLFNLAGNALKFVRPGVVPVIRLRAEERAETVRVWVEDNGLGIAPAYQEQIFRLFNRLDGGRYPGTGAGLAIVRKGAERMGGLAGVESTPGEGSRFWVELPKATSGSISVSP